MQDMTLLFDDYAIICKNWELKQVIFDWWKQVNVKIWDKALPIEKIKKVNNIENWEILNECLSEEEIKIKYYS